MSEVTERLDVACPYHLAQRYLADSLEGRAESGAPATWRLTVDVPGTQLAKNVVVTFAFATDPMHFDRPFAVHWTPEGGGPYPDFDGEMTVRAGEDYTEALLELRGSYRPPGGAAGEAFDRILGGRIASQTARHLLEAIAADMERRYREQEAAKR